MKKSYLLLSLLIFAITTSGFGQTMTEPESYDDSLPPEQTPLPLPYEDEYELQRQEEEMLYQEQQEWGNPEYSDQLDWGDQGDPVYGEGELEYYE
jgi:hypothetical protein